MTTKTDEQELLPCPFCGESKSLIFQHCEGTIIHPAYRIYCGNCGASNGYSDRVDPVKNWNSRAALQSQDREDALVQAIQEAIALLGPEAPSCSGCEYEWNHALRVLHEAIDHARRIEGEGNG